MGLEYMIEYMNNESVCEKRNQKVLFFDISVSSRYKAQQRYCLLPDAAHAI